MLEGLMAALSPDVLLVICIGVVGGIIMGALPGFTATMGTALLLPFTFTMEPTAALAMLGALYVAAMFADSVPACMINTPGTPSAMATALDGFKMTLQGKGRTALVASCFSAMVGTFIGGFCFLFLSGPLADVALTFGPPEFFWVGVFAVTIIASIAGNSMIKGIAGGAIGMLIGTVGLSKTGAESRYTFGFGELEGGVSLVAALIGVFALPQVLDMVLRRREKEYVAEYSPRRGEALEAVKAVMTKPWHLMRSGLLGTFVGILPGAGSPVASLLSYNEAVRWSKDRKRFGKGAIEGVTASETAGNAAAGGSMVPMMILGVPGSAPAAVILGALLLQGLRPGPTLFATDSTLVYSFAWAIILAGVATFAFGMVLSRGLVRMISIPVRMLAPIILFFSVIGSFAIRNYMLDVYFMIGLGVFCYLVSKIGFHAGPIGLGLILGPIVEPALVQSLALSEASSMTDVFLGSTVSIVLIALTAFSVGWSVYQRQRDRKKDAHEVHNAPSGDAGTSV
ncbi:tripartite tricarboxylate transporter permease [Qaidamihabitans albus]|uniref:tripartite tricarboxylate transporter permease n=1 Tax=Qaidamihabitans albus TaxID=2795733 RepID=UPI0018F26F76|nr:tripartite tricarboxylate transporter permease [Qaidamihabitans albus]